MQQRQDKIIYVVERNRISEIFLSKSSLLFSSLGLPCPAWPLLPCSRPGSGLNHLLAVPRSFIVCCETAGQVEENLLFESQSSLWLSGTAALLCAELSLASHSVGSHSSPLLTEDQRSHLTYQYRAEVIPFSAAFLVSLSETDVSTVDLDLFLFCSFSYFIFFLLSPVSEILHDLPVDFLIFMSYLIS